MDFRTAMDHAETQTLNPVYILVGTESMLRDLFIESLMKRLSSDGQVVTITKHRYEEEGADNALFECQTLSFFADKSIVVLENCTALLANGKSKFDTSSLEEYLTSPIPEKLLIITVDGDKIDERKKLTKLAKKHAVVLCAKPKDDEAVGILNAIAKADGIQINQDSLSALWHRSISVASCRSDLHKLWTYTNHSPILMTHIDDLVPLLPEDNVFEWLNFVVNGDMGKAFRVLTDMKQSGYDAFALLALIARQLRLMWFAKVFSEKGLTHQQIATRAGAHPYSVKVAAGQSRVFSKSRLEQLIVMAADVEYDAKSGKRDMEQALALVVASCGVTTDLRTGVK